MSSHQITLLFLDLALIVALAQMAGAVARRCGQPPVIGEIVAGILLGPTVLSGQLSEQIFPLEVRGELGAFANLGLALFMFKLGMESDWAAGRSTRRASVGIATAAMVFPFAVGAGLGLWWSPGGSPPQGVAPVLFMGVALSVTAFPVLARIVEDRGLARAPLGQLALASAALCDVLAWSMLGVVMVLCGIDTPWRLLWFAPYLLVMIAVVRPALRALARSGRTSLDLSLICIGVLASAAATEWMGLHFIVGAFVFGVVRTHALGGLEKKHWKKGDADLRRGLGSLDNRLLMPVFFVVAGWQVDLSGLDVSQLTDLVILLAAASGSKFLAVAGAARLSGLKPRDSAALGALMNTRGLTELIVLTAGRELGLLNDVGYTLLVTMAVLTTMSTGPILRRLLKDETTAGPAAHMDGPSPDHPSDLAPDRSGTGG
ncbi:cation/H(+) antiporter [Streptomyces malaysiensis subsp. malaysiensis]|uniref:cation:proton antiporter n=2 Tax=Streptomyces malaysiensis TaxID=92644 RepID=UPI000BFE9A59|nr:cation:proton antiporter [Streptomyces malaysiensis]ATL86854.1 sodium/hydrogen exchanger [Streptomyces malaysiensis]QDL69635.1 cation/H(+) antiporter [Streptomyces malaysiensis]